MHCPARRTIYLYSILFASRSALPVCSDLTAFNHRQLWLCKAAALCVIFTHVFTRVFANSLTQLGVPYTTHMRRNSLISLAIYFCGKVYVCLVVDGFFIVLQLTSSDYNSSLNVLFCSWGYANDGAICLEPSLLIILNGFALHIIIITINEEKQTKDYMHRKRVVCLSNK